MRKLHTDMPLGSERNSGSAVRFPVITTLLMLVAATAPVPFGLMLWSALGTLSVFVEFRVSSLERPSGTIFVRPGHDPASCALWKHRAVRSSREANHRCGRGARKGRSPSSCRPVGLIALYGSVAARGGAEKLVPVRCADPE